MLTPPQINGLIDHHGHLFKDFRLSLKPCWIRLWSEILTGYAVLIFTSFILIKLDQFTSYIPVCVIIGALILGYTHAYIQLFFHEAAHSNIAPSRKLNDFLANLVIGIIVGQDIKTYRLHHLQHHQKHGTTEDTERTYFDPLNIRFIIESLFGIKVIKVLLKRKQQTTKILNQKQYKFNKQILLGMLLHSCILITAIAYYHWAFTIAWILSIAVVLPFFGAVRQVLEHRSLEAKPEIDYTKISHGETNRLFGDSFLARTLGGAGFNRHLLHHWQPQISCTQLKNVENYLLNSPASGWVIQNSTTYTATFLQLMRNS